MLFLGHFDLVAFYQANYFENQTGDLLCILLKDFTTALEVHISYGTKKAKTL